MGLEKVMEITVDFVQIGISNAGLAGLLNNIEKRYSTYFDNEECIIIDEIVRRLTIAPPQ
jgi:hypothetical protein